MECWSWTVARKLVMLYCSYSSGMSLRCVVLGAFDDVKHACLPSQHFWLIAWKKPEGSGIITSRLFVSLKLLFAATCARYAQGSIHPSLYASEKRHGKQGNMPYWIHFRAHIHIFSHLPAPFICRELADGLQPVLHSGAVKMVFPLKVEVRFINEKDIDPVVVILIFSSHPSLFMTWISGTWQEARDSWHQRF